MKTAIVIVGIAALFLATGTAQATDAEYVSCYDDHVRRQGYDPDRTPPNPVIVRASRACKKYAPYGLRSNGDEGNCSPLKLPRALSKKPLTSRQVKMYKELRSIGITKKDAARVARDPGVKKGEWGWTRVGGASEGVMCMKNEGGSEELMKYRNNVVIE